MLEMVIAGGIVMLPLLACSVVALAVVIERFWTLQKKRVVPDNLVAQVWQWAQAGTLDEPKDLAPTVHFWTSSAQGWVVIPEGVAKLEKQ